MSERVHTAEPSPVSSLVSLLRPRRRPAGVPRFPEEVAVVPRARVAVRRLAAYRRALGLAERPELPALYPHVMFGRLHLAMLGDKGFPVSMLGAVHVGTFVRALAPLPVDAPYRLSARFEGVRLVKRGLVFGLVSELRFEDALVWTSLNTYQVMGRFGEADEGGTLGEVDLQRPGDDAVATAPWPLPSSLGRTYAGICGDYNPIHLSGPTARLFGFRGSIVHGYANLAIALDRLQLGQGPGALDALFKGPVFLGTSSSARRDDQGRFEVLSPADPRPAIVGAWRDGSEAPLPL